MDSMQGMVDRAVFTDEAVYRDELERVFGRAWLFLGHESLIPHANDFFLTYMGEDPVILCRIGSGQLRAFLNMCRHRGNRVVRADDGNAKNFMCAYHGWTYSNEGKLVSVPGLQEAYYGELEVDALGLVEVAQLDSYAGLVFATWAEDAPSLEAYLGDARWYMDIAFNRRAGGVEFLGPEKWVGGFNWKVSSDNFSGDNYHTAVSHRSAVIARAKQLGRPVPDGNALFANAHQGYGVAPGNGHGLSVRLFDTEDEFLDSLRATVRDPRLNDYRTTIQSEIAERLGSLRAHRVSLAVGNVFPNMSFLVPRDTVRVWNPRGPDRTEIWSYVVVDRAAPPELRDAARVNFEQSFGMSGMLEQDDMDNWRQSTVAGNSPVARLFPQDLTMGLGREVSHALLPGTVVNSFVSEVTQRALYGQWEAMMRAQSWVDLALAPSTARYEGTASFRM